MASEKYSPGCIFCFGNLSGKHYVQLGVSKVFLIVGSNAKNIYNTTEIPWRVVKHRCQSLISCYCDLILWSSFECCPKVHSWKRIEVGQAAEIFPQVLLNKSWKTFPSEGHSFSWRASALQKCLSLKDIHTGLFICVKACLMKQPEIHFYGT